MGSHTRAGAKNCNLPFWLCSATPFSFFCLLLSGQDLAPPEVPNMGASVPEVPWRSRTTPVLQLGPSKERGVGWEQSPHSVESFKGGLGWAGQRQLLAFFQAHPEVAVALLKASLAAKARGLRRAQRQQLWKGKGRGMWACPLSSPQMGREGTWGQTDFPIGMGAKAPRGLPAGLCKCSFLRKARCLCVWGGIKWYCLLPPPAPSTTKARNVRFHAGTKRSNTSPVEQPEPTRKQNSSMPKLKGTLEVFCPISP